jgi:hypothetical protein
MPPYLPLNAIFGSKLMTVVRSARGLTISRATVLFRRYPTPPADY